MCRGPEAAIYLACLGNRKEASLAGPICGRGKSGRRQDHSGVGIRGHIFNPLETMVDAWILL